MRQIFIADISAVYTLNLPICFVFCKREFVEIYENKCKYVSVAGLLRKAAPVYQQATDEQRGRPGCQEFVRFMHMLFHGAHADP